MRVELWQEPGRTSRSRLRLKAQSWFDKLQENWVTEWLQLRQDSLVQTQLFAPTEAFLKRCNHTVSELACSGKATWAVAAEPQQQRWPGHWELHPPFVYWLWCSLQNISTTFFLHMKWRLVFCQNLWPDRLITMEKNTLSTKHSWVLSYCDPSWKKKVHSYKLKA